MSKNLQIKNNSKSRRSFLQDLTKLIGGTAILAGVANIFSPGKSKAANGPANTQAGSDPYIGSIAMVGFNFAPPGWAFCDGQLLPINNYQALFSLLGTTYGGDGETTFGLPDLRGRVAIHPGSGPGLPSYSWGQRGGQPSITLNTNQIPAHTHTLRVNSGSGNSDNPDGKSIAANSEGIKHYSSNAPDKDAIANSITSTGGNQSINITPPYLAVYHIIALVGLYPSPN